MIMSILLMGVFRIGLDQMSLASLIIALGMLVDNAIVMSESIMVQMSGGKKALDAAIDSANELKIPLLTSSLTTAAAFLPIYLAESGVGEYCAPLFEVVTITLLSSWILSLTMIPMLLLCQHVAPPEDVGAATSLPVLTHNFGGALGAAVIAVTAAALVPDGGTVAEGVASAFWVVAGIGLLALLPATLLPRRATERALIGGEPRAQHHGHP